MIMIKITQTNGEDKLFENYHQVCDYINAIERRKASEPGRKIWRFMRRRYETLYSMYYRNPSLKNVLTPQEKEAVEKEMGFDERHIKVSGDVAQNFLFLRGIIGV